MTTYRQVRYQRPPGSTEIVLVRHGESAEADLDHPFPLIEGRGDPELSDLGRLQAEAVCTRLNDLQLGIEAIYTTPLTRTSQSAAVLTKATGLIPIVEPGLVEIHMGEWEGGRYRKHLADRDPMALAIVREERWDVIPGAESNAELESRTRAAIVRIAAAHPDATVAVFTHAVVISSVLAAAAHARPFAFISVDNASISRLVVTGELWTIRSFNDTSHLLDLG